MSVASVVCCKIGISELGRTLLIKGVSSSVVCQSVIMETR